MPYVVTGIDPSGLRSATRVSPASAIVLAMGWDGNGIQDVRIKPPGLEPRSFKDFRVQHFGPSPSASVRRHMTASGRDCQEFRVGAAIVDPKEVPDGTTQSTPHP